MFEPRVRAVLGPTNTGKTHLAITRLLAHASGIIGFPLRLLARENYDRMVAAKGERHVALITGEEKIVPPEAKWFACTVEAMPLDRPVEFLAVDEIQLCADPDRGHVFTDRLLNARGLVETMFLGAETIAPLLRRLVPQAEIETRPRLSQLTYAGPVKLTRLPPRSAVVAFSAAEVYAIAEAIRRRRGGCAVVMGRLSPRTRNAQVALYQNREVDFLVATDAIGMGLNMDVDHVAFASLTKFDGRQNRQLTPQELAQIAGRAGRGMRDGTFGTTAECPALPDDVVDKIERHNFEPLTALAWRNSDLDFSGIDPLLASLIALPPQPGLTRGNDATDYLVLAALARDPVVRDLAKGRERVRLLWEACQIPDYRKLADDSHTAFCGRVFGHLALEGRLPQDWVADQIAQLDRTDGDLDTLMARLASIRVWTYVASRADWVPDAAHFQAEARRVEDALSDALHEVLTARFVDRRAAHLMRRLDETEEDLLSAVTRRGEVVVEGHPVGRVRGFDFEPELGASGDEDEKRVVLRAARRALRDEIPRRVTVLEQSKDHAFNLQPDHTVTWTYNPAINAPPGLGDTAPVARLRPGPEPLKPQVEVLPSEFLDGAQRERIRARIAAWLEGMIKREFGALEAVEKKAEEDGALRGPAFRLREALGMVPGATEGVITPELRQRLKAIGVRAGRFSLYLPEALRPRAMALRGQLWALSQGIETPPLPPPGLVSIAAPPAEGEPPPGSPTALVAAWPPGYEAVVGWMPAGPVLLRLDVAERVAAELGYLTRRAPAMLPPDLASRLGVKADMLPAVLEALGFRLLPGGELPEGHYGPPTPPRVGHVPRPPAGAGRGGAQHARGGAAAHQRRPGRAAGEPAAAGAGAGSGEAEADRRGGKGERRRHGGGPAPAHAGGSGGGGPRRDQAAGAAGEGRPPRPQQDQQRPPPPPHPRGGRGPRRSPRPQRPDRRGEPVPVPVVSAPKPESPFAILATLKLRKAQ
ncbi:MAG: DEAD/DEAH box helicase [Acetobacteraceae bacterium]|nr:DEAD/DEAH box helicase [Acetobacteraceae bacterium]